MLNSCVFLPSHPSLPYPRWVSEVAKRVGQEALIGFVFWRRSHVLPDGDARALRLRCPSILPLHLLHLSMCLNGVFLNWGKLKYVSETRLCTTLVIAGEGSSAAVGVELSDLDCWVLTSTFSLADTCSTVSSPLDDATSTV